MIHDITFVMINYIIHVQEQSASVRREVLVSDNLLDCLLAGFCPSAPEQYRRNVDSRAFSTSADAVGSIITILAAHGNRADIQQGA